MERKFEMFCIRGVNKYGEVDEEMIGMFFKVDDEIVDECEEDNIDNIVFESYKMLHRNCEKYGFDGRRDKLKIDLRYEW